MLLLSASVALACSPLVIDPDRSTDIEAGFGIYVGQARGGTLYVDDVEVDARVHRLRGPGGQLVPELWLPDEPLVAGQTWRWEGDGPTRKGTVRSSSQDPFPLDLIDVYHGDIRDSGPCGYDGPHRRIQVPMVAWLGPLTVVDVDTDELVIATHIDHPTDFQSYLREGRDQRETCLQAFWLDALGDTHESEVVCSTDQPAGCSATGGAATGLWAWTTLVLLRRRRQ